MAIDVIEHSEFPQNTRLIAEWHQLQSLANDATLFTTPEWVQTWLEVFGKGKRCCLLEIRDGHDLLGIMPLIGVALNRSPNLAVYHDLQPEDRQYIAYQSNKKWLSIRQLSPLANLESANIRGVWLCKREHLKTVLNAGFSYLALDNAWDILLLPALKSEDIGDVLESAQAFGFHYRLSHQDSLLGFKVRGWEQYYAEQSYRFRRTFCNMLNRLNACGDIHIKTTTDTGLISKELAQMFELAKSSWKEQGRSHQAIHLPMTDAMEQFYLTLAQRGNAQMFSLTINGRLSGALLAYTTNDCIYAMQTYYDPVIAHVSPGRFLMRELIEWCFLNNINWVDMNGNSSMVTTFSDHEQKYQRIVLFRPVLYPVALFYLSSLALLVRQIRSWVLDLAKKTDAKG